MRGVLRDDPPGRPNPRLTPHAEGFWLHMKPTYYHRMVDGLYPTFRLGWLSTFFFAFEIVTGIFLMIYYTPSPLVAYENMLNLLGNVPFGQIMRDMHRLAAELMVIVVVLHMLRTFITGSYKKPRQFTWATGVILLGVTLVLSFSGYLLPWDQLSLWAVTIGASMAEAIPPEIVGRNINLLVRGAPEFGANGLLRFYLLHVVALPLAGIVAFGVHYYKVIHHGHSLPPEAEKVGEDTAKRVPMDSRVYFMPQILTRELSVRVRPAGDPVRRRRLPVPRPGARAARQPVDHTAAHHGPVVLPVAARDAQGRGQGHLGSDRPRPVDRAAAGAALPRGRPEPALRRPAHRASRRPLSWCAPWPSCPTWALRTTPSPPRLTRRRSRSCCRRRTPARCAVHPGRRCNLGSYEAAAWADAPNATLRDLLHEFNTSLTTVVSADRTNVAGVMVIEDWQTDLKKVTLRVTWTNVADGSAGEFSQSVYLHRNGRYGQGA